MGLLGQYPYEICYGHPRANRDGAVYKHVLVAEQKLGRYLKPEETVHHIDKDKNNYNPDNLLIFATKADHSRFHMKNFTIDDLIEIEPNVYITPIQRCKYCNIPICRDATMCVNCYNKYENSKVKNRPSKEELNQLLFTEKGNFTKIGKIYGVTDNAIRKWCKKYEMPYHSKDYK